MPPAAPALQPLGAASAAARRCGCGGATSSCGSSPTTLLMSLGVVLLLGVVVIGQVRNGLLDAKAQGRAEPGRGRLRGRPGDGRRRRRHRGPTGTARTGSRGTQDAGTWLTDLVEQLASGGQGVFSVVALSSDSDDRRRLQPRTRGPRASGDVDPEREHARRAARKRGRAARDAPDATRDQAHRVGRQRSRR